MKRLLVPSAALLWGLQFAFLNPALAFMLVALFNASPQDVGWVLAVYNASGFLASLLVPAYADRTGDYLRPLLACGVLTLALAGLLALSTSLPAAVVGLIVLGGPAGVGSSLLFAHLKHSGAAPSDVINTRAIVSFAWVAGPPLATFIMGTLGSRAILPALATVALLNVATTAAMIARRAVAAAAPLAASAVRDETETAGPGATLHADREEPAGSQVPAGSGEPAGRRLVAPMVIGFIALQATNSAAVSVMGLFVTENLGLDVMWAGIVLGISAGLEIPALLLIGRLSRRFHSRTLIMSGCLAGTAYYAAMAFVAGPVALIALQLLNAWFFAVVAGVGLTLFQEIIPRPGLASGLYANTRRLGAIVSGPVIGIGSMTAFGYRGAFAACACLALLALGVISTAARRPGQAPGSVPENLPAKATGR